MDPVGGAIVSVPNTITEAQSVGRAREDSGGYGDISISGNAQSHLGDQYFYGPTSLHLTSDEIAKQERILDESIIAWLGPDSYNDRHNEISQEVLRGTCQPFLNSEAYGQWRSVPGQNLLVTGIPGAGKTFCSAVVISDLRKAFVKDSKVAILFLYSNHKKQSEQTPSSLLASLLRQAYCSCPVLEHAVQKLYLSHRGRGRNSRPDRHELCDCLSTVLARFDRTFIVINALDECITSDLDLDSGRTTFLKHLATLKIHLPNRISVMITSRPLEGIDQLFPAMRLTFRASEQDLSTYIAKRLDETNKERFRKPDIREEVQHSVSSISDGMFLLARLMMDQIVVQATPRAIRAVLKKAQASNAVQLMYDESIQRMLQGSQSELAGRAISCMVFSRQPLKLDELLQAVALEEGMRSIDEDDLHDVQDVVSACIGLLNIDTENRSVALAHQTTADYFSGLRNLWFDTYRNFILKACCLCLSLDLTVAKPLWLQGVRHDFVVSVLNQQYPFFAYALEYWTTHLQDDLNKEHWSLILRVLQDQVAVQLAFNHSIAHETPEVTKQEDGINEFGSGVRWMHLLAYCRLNDILTFVLHDEALVQILEPNLAVLQDSSLAARQRFLVEQVDSSNNDLIAYAAAGDNIVLLKEIVIWKPIDFASQNRQFLTAIELALRLDKRNSSALLLGQSKGMANIPAFRWRRMLKYTIRNDNVHAFESLLNLELDRVPSNHACINCMYWVDKTTSVGILEVLMSHLADFQLERVRPLLNLRSAKQEPLRDAFIRVFQGERRKLQRSLLLHHACSHVDSCTITLLRVFGKLDIGFASAETGWCTPLMALVNGSFTNDQSLRYQSIDLLMSITSLCTGSEVNAINVRNGMTVMHYLACWTFKCRNDLRLSRLSAELKSKLLMCGANKSIKDHKGRLPDDIARYGPAPDEKHQPYYCAPPDDEHESEDEIVMSKSLAFRARRNLPSERRWPRQLVPAA